MTPLGAGCNAHVWWGKRYMKVALRVSSISLSMLALCLGFACCDWHYCAWPQSTCPQLEHLWIRTTTAVLCLCVCIYVSPCGFVWSCVHTLAAWPFVCRQDFALTGCWPSCSPFSLSGYQHSVYSVATLCCKVAKWNEFTFLTCFCKKSLYGQKGI